VERREGSLRVSVDVPKRIAEDVRTSSGHARLAFLRAKTMIERGAADLYRALKANPHIGHDDLLLRICLQCAPKKTSTGIFMSIDDVWLNTEPNAASTLTQKLRAAQLRLEKSSGIAPLGETSAQWLLDTTSGTYRVRAATAEQAPLRLLALSGKKSIEVITVARVIESCATAKLHTI
jgi:hypothetical protein